MQLILLAPGIIAFSTTEIGRQYIAEYFSYSKDE
jgi:hypothetical protein